jgi:hypothetical protein
MASLHIGRSRLTAVAKCRTATPFGRFSCALRSPFRAVHWLCPIANAPSRVMSNSIQARGFGGVNGLALAQLG